MNTTQKKPLAANEGRGQNPAGGGVLSAYSIAQSAQSCKGVP